MKTAGAVEAELRAVFGALIIVAHKHFHNDIDQACAYLRSRRPDKRVLKEFLKSWNDVANDGVEIRCVGEVSEDQLDKTISQLLNSA